MKNIYQHINPAYLSSAGIGNIFKGAGDFGYYYE